QQHARHERLAVHRVVADGQRLPVGAEDHFLVGDHAGDPQCVHPHPLDLGAAGAGQFGGGGVGGGGQARLGACRADQFGGAVGGAAGGVGLVRVVQFDDLG